ncbi:hypothetical protein PR048_013286 [Dryococelus australis]|uniref:Uncharacterized protein n=1 Tax=Dryococelus australis TaxID=614101 RepID=A0ABQ9HRR3_9NEOP|nr:hypothetical protein PR048_013286 [Dryococelus australis]
MNAELGAGTHTPSNAESKSDGRQLLEKRERRGMILGCPLFIYSKNLRGSVESDVEPDAFERFLGGDQDDAEPAVLIWPPTLVGEDAGTRRRGMWCMLLRLPRHALIPQLSHHHRWQQQQQACSVSLHLSMTTIFASVKNYAVPNYHFFGEPGSIPYGVVPGFPHVEYVPGSAYGQWVSSVISRFPRPCIPAFLYTHLASSPLALKTSMLTAVKISSLHSLQWKNHLLAMAYRIHRSSMVPLLSMSLGSTSNVGAGTPKFDPRCLGKGCLDACRPTQKWMDSSCHQGTVQASCSGILIWDCYVGRILELMQRSASFLDWKVAGSRRRSSRNTSPPARFRQFRSRQKKATNPASAHPTATAVRLPATRMRICYPFSSNFVLVCVIPLGDLLLGVRNLLSSSYSRNVLTADEFQFQSDIRGVQPPEQTVLAVRFPLRAALNTDTSWILSFCGLSMLSEYRVCASKISSLQEIQEKIEEDYSPNVSAPAQTLLGAVCKLEITDSQKALENVQVATVGEQLATLSISTATTSISFSPPAQKKLACLPSNS